MDLDPSDENFDLNTYLHSSDNQQARSLDQATLSNRYNENTGIKSSTKSPSESASRFPGSPEVLAKSPLTIEQKLLLMSQESAKSGFSFPPPPHQASKPASFNCKSSNLPSKELLITAKSSISNFKLASSTKQSISIPKKQLLLSSDQSSTPSFKQPLLSSDQSSTPSFNQPLLTSDQSCNSSFKQPLLSSDQSSTPSSIQHSPSSDQTSTPSFKQPLFSTDKSSIPSSTIQSSILSQIQVLLNPNPTSALKMTTSKTPKEAGKIRKGLTNVSNIINNSPGSVRSGGGQPKKRKDSGSCGGPFQCVVCRKQFSEKKKMKEHVRRIHFKLMAECSVCGRRVVVRKMKKHKQTVHNM